MKVKRASAQSRQSLYEFYEEQSGEVGEHMLALLTRLEDLADTVPFWGLTSHARLNLLAEDDWRSPWLATVVGGRDGYYVSYLLPAEQAPWAGARVECVALDLESACQMLIVAMRLSGGWSAIPGANDISKIKSASPFEVNNRSREWTQPVKLSSDSDLSRQFREMIESNADDYWIKEQGPTTLRLLHQLEQLGARVPIWASIPTGTPNPNILLQPAETLGDSYAMVRCGIVGCSMPAARAPYPGAEVSGASFEGGVSEEETFRRLLIAMHRCGGWPEGLPLIEP